MWILLHSLQEIHKINDDISGTIHDSLFKHTLFPSVHLIELAENKPQHKQQSFPGIFPILILYVDPSPVNILCTLNIYLCM